MRLGGRVQSYHSHLRPPHDTYGPDASLYIEADWSWFLMNIGHSKESRAIHESTLTPAHINRYVGSVARDM